MPNTREKLIGLIGDVQDNGTKTTYEERSVTIETKGNDKIADHLIANGVTIPVRCKDCYYYEKQYPGFGFCKFFGIGMADNDFCSRCIRRDG